MEKKDVLKLAGCIILCLSAGLLGSIATAQSVSAWYVELNKPSFNPPNWVFGPIWTLLYLMMGTSLYLVLRNGFKDEEVKKGVAIFAVQLILNTLWSFAFFGMKSPLAGIVVIIPLWLAIALTIIQFKKTSEKAAYLLLPYLAWVSFATILNLSITLLN
ncbi:MAG TPA: tryptophan-rich sensory protein [Candidatus Altiarchaeales archaeon]|nr:tryptophan-rich sensory protein [Candidatus Altiarchaeales archaeon]